MNILRKIKLFVFPERCFLCRSLIEDGMIVCDGCMKEIKEKRLPLIRGAAGFRCVSSFVYGGKVRRAVIAVKYHERVQYLEQIAKIMEEDIRDVYRDYRFDLVTFVPMHPKDVKKRGYNQSRLLAREVARLLGVPCLETLEKIKRTKKQQECSYSERKANLSGAFRLIDKDAVRGKSVLIIDDVVTTGTSLGQCCRVINRSKPDVLCCATIAATEHQIDQEAII